ncbi:NADH-quinone oxidoreductase subunit NuoI [Limnochorda pilosa]|uniref:NADH-quinone oxidoreductase subunit I n=1 Tax=Limnochorda pilosa TaxID=1555112 RepID=A0A0K2SQ31_LIMPI|nr:NADH-quinone oxidoreductase subunit NuoI [Limnochorda pilosa]BAS28939.1 NADH-quinone oxidoreductase subunit I [Limnochorda pilosa]
MLRELAVGFETTLKNFFAPKVTIPYPEQKKPRAQGFRGLHELRRYANGLEMCVGCELCQVACPANAITVQAAENDPANPHSPGERYAYEYRIDLLRCIFCGLCEEACPTGALHLTQEFELSETSRKSLVYGRDRLVRAARSGGSVPVNVYPDFRGHRPLADIQASEQEVAGA